MSDSSHAWFHQREPWKHNNNSIWLGSTICLNRNLEKFKFPGKLPVDKRKQIISILSKDLLTLQKLQNPTLIKAEDMQPLEKEFLVEHFLSFQSYAQAQSGEAFILDDSGTFLASINLGDHLNLYTIDTKGELESSWENLVEIEKKLNETVNFAFSRKFGFLSSDPTQCGTGLIVHVFMHLPALIYTNQLEEMIKKFSEEGIIHMGLQGNPNEILGDIVAFQNGFTLGVTEENILSSLRSLTTKLLVEEKKARTELKNKDGGALKDKISRAYAILLHSYQMEAIEALSAISLLKLGLDLNWITGISHETLNELLFSSRRAHLLCLQDSKFGPEEIFHKRAEFIHEAIKGISLHI